MIKRWRCAKKRTVFHYIFIRFCGTKNVSSSAWKCFRCDLTFKEIDHAKLHQEISKHSVRSVKTLTA